MRFDPEELIFALAGERAALRPTRVVPDPGL
jgi:hypothetical protein